MASSGSFSTSVFKTPYKLPVHWSSQVPRNWKKNAILTSLYRAKRIASSWEPEVLKIKENFSKAAYPIVRDVINPSIDRFPSFCNCPPAPSHKNPSYLFFRHRFYQFYI